ncbi:MAG: acyltransferase, partial [Candidatus Helarchaeota archaeon]
CGKSVLISNNVKIIKPEKIYIGNRVKITDNCILDGSGGVIIGDDSMIGIHSMILTNMHRFDQKDVSIRDQGSTYKPVKIGKDVWLGARTIVLPGVIIGNHSIIGANSVVSKSIPENSIAVGSPAKIIKKREFQTGN